MNRWRTGTILAATLVIGLFVAGGMTQRLRDADSEGDVAEVSIPSPQGEASIPAPRQATVAVVATRTPRLVVAFQLDPALTRGHYLGERWVSPSTFRFAQAVDRYTVRARLQQIDDRGERVDINGHWATGDPDMLAITRLDGGIVQLDVAQSGQTELTVNAAGESRVLQVEAHKTPDAMDVAFRQ
jgi:hypothetical protein